MFITSKFIKRVSPNESHFSYGEQKYIFHQFVFRLEEKNIVSTNYKQIVKYFFSFVKLTDLR